MIRLNAFFEIKDPADCAKAIELGTELTQKSLLDKGNIAYDLFRSTTRPQVMMFCETWDNEEDLAAHAASAHFTTLVPAIETLTVNGLKLERFEF